MANDRIKVCSLQVGDVFKVDGMPLFFWCLKVPIHECKRNFLIEWVQFGKVYRKQLRMTDYVTRVSTDYEWFL